MQTKTPRERRLSYVVVVENATGATGDLRDLAGYLSSLDVAGCEVVILDRSPRLQYERNARVLRWVGRHLAVRPEHCSPEGSVDAVRAAVDLAACEKVIVAADDVRYSGEAIDRICALLDVHEVAEPQDYLDPLPWWEGFEAARILVHRGIEPQPDHGATIGLRRSAVAGLRMLPGNDVIDDHGRRLEMAGAEVHAAADVFVQRQPRPLSEWLLRRPRIAADDFPLRVKSAFFFSLLPLLLLLGIVGGARLAGGYAGVIAFASVGLALRGRAGAAAFFPLRACLFAPLWVLERSLAVYWALAQKLRGPQPPLPLPASERGHGSRAASGE